MNSCDFIKGVFVLGERISDGCLYIVALHVASDREPFTASVPLDY